MKFGVVARKINHTAVRISFSREGVSLGELEMSPQEWNSFKLILGSGAAAVEGNGVKVTLREEEP